MNKIKKIAIFTSNNYYDSKKHFSTHLKDSLEKLGAEVLLIDFSINPLNEEIFFQIKAFDADLTLSFNSQDSDQKGKYLWDYLKTPHLSMLLDPSLFYQQYVDLDYCLISCVDKFDVEWFKKRNTSSYFIPHAIEKSLKFSPNTPREADIVFIGSVYDPEAALETLRKNFSPELLEVTLRTLERTQKEKDSPYTYVLEEELKNKNISLEKGPLKDLAYQIDLYLRGAERLDLIRSIHSHEVHIFGGTGFQEPQEGRSWQELLKGKKNIIFHNATSYTDSLQVLKHSKISLNSAPFFKNGTHERIFASLMAGALPITNNNIWVEENFTDGVDILTFDRNHFEEVDSKISKYLNDENLRCDVVKAGQKKVLQHHTWDNRAQDILNLMDDL